MEYRDYVDAWISGISNEVMCWENYVATDGWVYFYRYRKTVSSERPFELEEDIPDGTEGKEYKFIDVGSGPFSRCGFVSKKVNLSAVSVDPLADIYQEIKEKYGVDNKIQLVSGFVEFLDKKFEKNSFDMVHMSNSLDHCFSPVDGIAQLLYICKIGGKIILRHGENEAVREGYQGLHQWNLSLENEENSFVIWGKDQRIDVCKEFENYADFELIPNVIEESGCWKYNKVIMTKKRDIQPRRTDYYETLLEAIYREFLRMNLKAIEEQREQLMNQPATIFQQRLAVVKKACANIEENSKRMISSGIGKVTLYGFGMLGRNLQFLLQEIGIEIVQKIDARGTETGDMNVITLDECKLIEGDAVIMSIDNEEVYGQLMKMAKVYKVDEFLELLE